MAAFSQIQSVSLREQVVAQIRTAIIEGRLKPGDHIVEQALTEQLGVSRTPVREALILLEREGLLVASRNRGCFVRVFTRNDVAAIFSMRTMLENFAAELIVERLTADDYEHLEATITRQRQFIEQGDFKNVRSTDMSFHRYLVERSGHPLLCRSWAELVAQIAALLYVRADAIPDYDETMSIRDHEAILNAYRNRDIEALRTINKCINERVAGECCRSLEK